MITEKDSISMHPYRSRSFDMFFEGGDYAVLDIETTGLSPKRSSVILIGILRFRGSSAETVQFFAESPSEEAEILEAAADELKDADFLVTYNGASFDIPFLEERCRKKGVKFPKKYDFDLYNIVRRSTDIKKITGSLKQKDIERYLGMASSRDDEIDGGESVKMYFEYVKSRDQRLRRFILLHNHDDIIQLARIMTVLKTADLNEALAYYGFPCGLFDVKNITVSQSSLTIKVLYGRKTAGYTAFPTADRPYSVSIDPDGTGVFDIPAEKVAGGVYVIDAEKILGDRRKTYISDDIFEYPAFSSGFLILKNGEKTNYLEIDSFVKCFLSDFPEI
ncbi:MAG: ribonuclease H-like domain-containing protein [Anaerovoracaceae bacterium]